MSTVETSVGTNWPMHTTRHGWLAAELHRDRQTFTLRREHLAALQGFARKYTEAKLPFQATSREQFRHPALDTFFADMVAELKCGKGLVFLRGVPVDGCSLDELRMLFWGIGTHVGEALSQSVVGDKMGDVLSRPGSSRGYTNDNELDLHTDETEIGALLCIQPAKSGGINVFASSLVIWDIVEREHPEYLPVLKKGFRTWRYDEHRAEEEPITPYHVPIFGEREGLRSVNWFWVTADAAARYIGEPLTPLQKAALTFLYQVSRREELRFSAGLERGEAVFFSNFEVMHARTAFTQWEDPAKTRHLLRLWLQSQPSRPIPKEMITWVNPSGLLGRDPDPRFADQKYVKLGDNPVARFMKEYFADYYSGKLTGSQLLMRQLAQN